MKTTKCAVFVPYGQRWKCAECERIHVEIPTYMSPVGVSNC